MATPVCPLAVPGLVTTGAITEIVKVTPRLPVAVAFVAETMALNVPPLVGVPEMRPVDVLTLSPGGSPLALKLVGLWVAVIWYVIGLPTPPTAELALVMTGGPNVMVKVTPRLPVPVPLVANTV